MDRGSSPSRAARRLRSLHLRAKGGRLVDRFGPLDQVKQTLVERHTGRPAQIIFRFCDVADVIRLVSLAPVRERELRLAVGQLADLLDDLEQVSLVLRAAADVVDLPARLIYLVDHDRVQGAKVSRVEKVPHLRAVAVDRERTVVEDRMDEMGYPALVLGSVLVGAVDAALPQDDGIHAKAAGVVANVLVGSALAAAVRAVEVDRLAFFTGNVVSVELSIHLIRRCENKRRLRIVQPRGLQEIESAARVDVEIRARVDE